MILTERFDNGSRAYVCVLGPVKKKKSVFQQENCLKRKCGEPSPNKSEEKCICRARTMSNALKTPDFISENKSFSSYERDLRRWSRLTTLDKKKQAEWIVLHLEGRTSGIKEKIET